MRKIPMRRCLATNESFPKKELLRIVKTPEGDVKVDITGKMNGKGAYISKNLEALDIAKKKGLINKALGVVLSEEVYQDIEKIIISTK